MSKTYKPFSADGNAEIFIESGQVSINNCIFELCAVANYFIAQKRGHVEFEITCTANVLRDSRCDFGFRRSVPFFFGVEVEISRH